VDWWQINEIHHARKQQASEHRKSLRGLFLETSRCTVNWLHLDGIFGNIIAHVKDGTRKIIKGNLKQTDVKQNKA